MDSGRFARLSPETQEMRRRILNGVCATAIGYTVRDLTKKNIMAGKVRREGTPWAAINYLKVMSQLCAFAVDAGYMTENPCLSIEKKAPQTDGHHTWTVDEVERYQQCHPVGTRARLAMDVLLFTGFRRADAVKLGKQHIRNGVIFFRTSKNGVEVEIPLLAPLAASINASPKGDLALLSSEAGRPWKKESFGNWFADQCKSAGVPGRAHGLRKAGATFAANNGATDTQLAAMYGWRSPRQASTYTRKVDRAHLAKQAANALSPHPETSVPAPSTKTGS